VKVAIGTAKGWVEIPADKLDEARRLLKTDIQRLRFMMFADVGWTGMIFEREGIAFMIWESLGHVVDVRGLDKRHGWS
jgi:hypothetical protein